MVGLTKVILFSLVLPPLYSRLVDESLRWFTVQGKSKEAEEFIVKVAKRNGVEAGEILGKYRCADRDLPRSKNTNVTGKTEVGNGIFW